MGNITWKKPKLTKDNPSPMVETQQNESKHMVNIEIPHDGFVETFELCKTLSNMVINMDYKEASIVLEGLDAWSIGQVIYHATCRNMTELILFVTGNCNFHLSDSHKQKLGSIRFVTAHGIRTLLREVTFTHHNFDVFKAVISFPMNYEYGFKCDKLDELLSIFCRVLEKFAQKEDLRNPKHFVEYEKILDFIWAYDGFRDLQRKKYVGEVKFPFHITIQTGNQKWFNILLPDTLQHKMKTRILSSALDFCQTDTPLDIWIPLLQTIFNELSDMSEIKILRRIIECKRKDILTNSTIRSKLLNSKLFDELFHHASNYDIIESLMEDEGFMMRLSMQRDHYATLMIQNEKFHLLDKFHHFMKTNAIYAKYKAVVKGDVEDTIVEEGNEHAY